MKVTIVDRRAMDSLYGTSAFPGVITRTIEIDDNCPKCGGPRGKPRAYQFHEWGEWHQVSVWTNPCGHLDHYSDLLKERDAWETPDDLPMMLKNQAD